MVRGVTSNNSWSMMMILGTEHWSESSSAEILGFFMFGSLLIYMYKESKKVKLD